MTHRRHLLRWAATAGIGALVAACRPAAAPLATRSSSPAPSPTATAPPTSTPVATPVPSPTTATVAPLRLVCRDAWRARPAAGGLRPHVVERLTVHHSAAAATDTTQGPGHLRGYQAFHMDDRGWPDIAYHVGVDRAGVAYRLRDWDTVGDTGTDYDPTGHFLLLVDGDFGAQEVADAQFATAARVLAWASGHFGVALDTVSGHRDHAHTECPGDALYVRLGELASRASELVASGPVPLEEVCGPAATEAVATLESGGPPGPLA